MSVNVVAVSDVCAEGKEYPLSSINTTPSGRGFLIINFIKNVKIETKINAKTKKTASFFCFLNKKHNEIISKTKKFPKYVNTIKKFVKPLFWIGFAKML